MHGQCNIKKYGSSFKVYRYLHALNVGFFSDFTATVCTTVYVALDCILKNIFTFAWKKKPLKTQ